MKQGMHFHLTVDFKEAAGEVGEGEMTADDLALAHHVDKSDGVPIDGE